MRVYRKPRPRTNGNLTTRIADKCPFDFTCFEMKKKKQSTVDVCRNLLATLPKQHVWLLSKYSSAVITRKRCVYSKRQTTLLLPMYNRLTGVSVLRVLRFNLRSYRSKRDSYFNNL